MATTCDINGKKPEITYPCEWKYKIISKHDDPSSAIKSVLGKKEYKLSASNNSKSGKYKGHNLSTLVMSEDERVAIFEELRAHKDIKFVL